MTEPTAIDQQIQAALWVLHKAGCVVNTTPGRRCLVEAIGPKGELLKAGDPDPVKAVAMLMERPGFTEAG